MKKILILIFLLMLSMPVFGSVEEDVDAMQFSSANGALTDHFAGMQWQDNVDVKTVTVSWYRAVDYCSDLALAGHSDWRLPSRDELKYAFEKRGNFQYLNYKSLEGVYWSSTEDASNSDSVRTIQFYSGNESVYRKTSKYYYFSLRCVRGNQFYDLNTLQGNVLKTRAAEIQKKYNSIYSSFEKGNSVTAYQQFIQNYPNAPQVIDAKKRLVEFIEQNYEMAQQKKTIAAYMHFIENFPKSLRAREAVTNIYSLTSANNSIAGYKWFIENYSEAPQAKDACLIMHQLAFDVAESLGTLQAYNDFIIVFPYAKQVNEATRMAYDIEDSEYSSWFGCTRSGERNSRALLVKSKQLERMMNDVDSSQQDGYRLVINRMNDLLQNKYPSEEATLRYLESEEFKDFYRDMKSSLSRINGFLEKISANSSDLRSIMQTQSQMIDSHFRTAAQSSEMADEYTKQHRYWERFIGEVGQ
ncbi:MAG: DUF1566 domain-containing protein [Deltaproteobacteria bacterium]|nr:DUF1566 domain-containing protein [Deltaproteobacteria bacterium]